MGCQVGNREILTIMGVKLGLLKFPAGLKSKRYSQITFAKIASKLIGLCLFRKA
jgi:hypothetical protein